MSYRTDLSTSDLIEELGTLRRRRLSIERLVCRYLADLTDRMGRDPRSPFGGGYADVFEIAEGIFGYGTRQTRERIRVGRALRRLPGIEAALESGDISFARVREITRVARAENEATWLELGRKLPIRELQKRVGESGTRGKQPHARGPSRGSASTTNIRMVLDLTVNDWIRLQEALRTVRDRASRVLTDAEAVMALATEVTISVNQPEDVRRQAGQGPPRVGVTEVAHRTVPTRGVDPSQGTDQARCAARASGADCGRSTKQASGLRIARLERAARAGAEPHAASTRTADGPREAAHDDPAGSRRAERTNPLDDPAGSRDGRDSSDLTSDGPAGSNQASEYEDSMLRDAARLLQHLPSRPRWSIDDLCEATNLRIGAALAALLELELQGTVRRNPIGFFSMRDAA